MARTPIVAGNWKMNTTASSARDLVYSIRVADIDAIEGVEKIVCPPFVYLSLAAELTKGSSLKIGAQDVYWEQKGAFTGEVSPEMLRDFAEYVIIGHSERRALFGETDEFVNKKLFSALDTGLTPIVCVGESGSERAAGQTLTILRRQVHGALRDIELPATAIIAYEPVWAIGTGIAATAEDANDAIAYIRGELARLQGQETADAVRILYGGSVNATNITEFVSQPEVDGGLVGGASLDAKTYVAMCQAVAG